MIEVMKLNQKQIKDSINEIKILKTLDCPQIIKYEESFVKKEHILIITEYADGGDLYQLIDRMKRQKTSMPEPKIVAIFHQLCLAIKYIHDKKIMHRDLKTQNIFLTQNQ